MKHSFVFVIFWLGILLLANEAAWGQATAPVPAYGPYNATFLADGLGLKKSIKEYDAMLRGSTPWSMSCWVRTDVQPQLTLIAGLGDPLSTFPRYLGLRDGKLVFWTGATNFLESPIALSGDGWHFVAVTFNGTEARLYSDGAEVSSGKIAVGPVSPAALMIAPETRPVSTTGIVIAPPARPEIGRHFGGQIAQLSFFNQELNVAEVASLYAQKPTADAGDFEEGSKPWPVQTRGQAGQPAPQDPSSLPRGVAPFSRPSPAAVPAGPALKDEGAGKWAIPGGWRLQAAPKVKAAGAEIAAAGFDASSWMQATVPGTVLTTMIDRGVYPDPDYGLNNMAIPESLSTQDYWYRNEFAVPAAARGQRLTLTFNGINYVAVVWLNGQKLGVIKGAFTRGQFDVTSLLKSGTNVIAVQIQPPPHPGIAHEQSIMAGAGDNGGMMALDGPTFAATEGWDWIPGIRDRNIGIWQDVTLDATGDVKIGDAQVVTRLPLPDTSRADVIINVPLENNSTKPVKGELEASFDQVSLKKSLTVPPGGMLVKLAPAEFAQLTVLQPRLWWPNGYGKPELYQLKLSFQNGSGKRGVSDTKQVRFGIREITYELSLFDSTGHLKRLDVTPADGVPGQALVNQSHDGLLEIADGWAASLAPGAETSPAVKPSADMETAPDLVIKVNGVRIACKGGNWGMDDSRKRVSRDRLEPYFRLHRDANLNMIRNWMGQDTEETFYDLADEYGLLVWNDFWDSTQNYNLEPDNSALFLANAKDTILRFRNHPSIAVWCGRNEGVPSPAINRGLSELIEELDGTRYYSASSNRVNLHDSGPYKYQEPEEYFTKLALGFAVELGIPSVPTLESLRSFIPEPDQWPISDTWAYHDWHQGGNGDVAPFMETLAEEFEPPANLEDFERKAQMLSYVDHRAIFEGFNAHLWKPNSGRLLWMTQPAWPSTMWQILSHDYDTQASFYAVKKACEPVHVQMNLPGYDLAVLNNTETVLKGLTLHARVFDLHNKLLLEHEAVLDAAANSVTAAFPLEVKSAMTSGVVLVKLELKDAAGKLIADNFYWQGGSKASYRELDSLAPAAVTASATSSRNGAEAHVTVTLKNNGSDVALEEKLTLVNVDDGSRILPAYYSDNYVSLLPGEERSVVIDYPVAAAHGAAKLNLRGWNMAQVAVAVSQ